MKDKQVKVEEVESSHTLGVSGEGHDVCKGEGSGDRVDATLVENTLTYIRLL